MSRRALLLAIALSGLLGCFLEVPRLEQLLYDVRLRLANRWFPERIAMDRRILVVGVEPESYRAIPKHPVFWLDLYTQAMQRALRRGATRVGLDFLPTYVDSRAARQFAQVATDFPDQIKLIAYWDAQQKTIEAPPPELILPLGVHNLALANLSLDQDGVARFQQLDPLRTPALYGRQDWSFLATALAQQEASRVWINYSAAEPRRVSFHEFLDKPQDLQGALLLIGSRARIDQDLVIGPGGYSMFGVDYQAQLLNTLLQGRPLRPLDGRLLLCLCLAALVTAAARLPRLSLVGLTLALLLIGWLGASLALLVACDRLLAQAPALLALPLCCGLTTAWRWRSERRLLQVLSGYVAPEILQEMLAEPSQWLRSLNQRREVTILFSDIDNFSTHCERESPEVVAAWLNEHYQELTRIFFAHQGTVIRFVGDQFMVLFGSPKSIAEPERQAVQAALAVQARMSQLHAFHQVKIAVHCGSMLLAVLGNQQKREYTAIGDEANVAARIQSLCKELSQPILVSQAVYERLAGQFDFEYQGSHEVKGRTQPVEVYSLA
ncbi:MAG: adenylate/guanylate cyclase domain-containing protein [Candidatus Eremiobacteraeota bacterium]|nr:adenylate/guanylate cyclase domain-containing protein [Candidatus Eremiobacteraeota bacterium]